MALFGRNYEYDYGYRGSPRRYGRDYYSRDYDRGDYDLGDGFYRTIGRWGDPYARRGRRPTYGRGYERGYAPQRTFGPRTYDRGYRSQGSPRRMRFVAADSWNRGSGYGGDYRSMGNRGGGYGWGYSRGRRDQGYDRGGWFW